MLLNGHVIGYSSVPCLFVFQLTRTIQYEDTRYKYSRAVFLKQTLTLVRGNNGGNTMAAAKS